MWDRRLLLNKGRKLIARLCILVSASLLIAACGIATATGKTIQPAAPSFETPTSAKSPLPSQTEPTQEARQTDEPLTLTPLPAIPTATDTPGKPGWCRSDVRVPEGFLVIGYLPDYRELQPGWGNCLTDIIYFSAEPLDSGELDTGRFKDETLALLQQMKADYGVRLHVSLGGFNRSGSFSYVVRYPQVRARFVENLVQFCRENNFDGVDLDWEFPETDAEIDGYLALMEAIKAQGLLVSVALYPYKDIEFSPYALADRIHVMSYSRGLEHSTFQQAIEDLQLFEDNGIPRERLALGIPFYGRQTIDPYRNFSYAQIIQDHQPGPNVDLVENIVFNGIFTVQTKTCYAREHLFAGVMIWELGQDSLDQTSLLRAIFEAAVNGCALREYISSYP